MYGQIPVGDDAMVRRALVPVLGLLVLMMLPLISAGCGNSPSSPSGYEPYSQIDLVFGDGATAETGKVLTVSYNGWFFDSTKADKKGVQFTSSTLSGPAVFTAGANTVIEGWEKGVVGMKEGGQRRLIIPPSLAYGPNRYSAIPPNTTLVFDLELLKVE
jgi:FKBP-type peptidyl-prolyl cis-trans isomerase FkpA